MATIMQGQFDGEGYLDLHPDVRNAGVDAWHHFKANGYKEGRAIAISSDSGSYTGQFSPADYVGAYPDLVKAGVNGWDHYSQHGFNEGRDAVVVCAEDEEASGDEASGDEGWEQV